MFSPPTGYVDCETDAEIDQERRGEVGTKYHEIDVPGVGLIHARRPLPNAIPALANAANAKITASSRLDYLVIFIQNHLSPGESGELLSRMLDPDTELPTDTMLRVSRAIATAGTARPI